MNYKIISLLFILICSNNLRAADFNLKFCTNDKSSSVTVKKQDLVVNVNVTYTVDGNIYNNSMIEAVINQLEVSEKDKLDAFSEASKKNIISGQVYTLISSGTRVQHSEFIGLDSNGDINLLDINGSGVFQTIEFVGSVNNCM